MGIASLFGCTPGAWRESSPQFPAGASICGDPSGWWAIEWPDTTPGSRRLARVAERVAERRNTKGRCYSAVAESVRKATGVRLSGPSAFVAADQLSHSSFFDELAGVCAEDLPELPPGATVVWPRTARSPHGHIAVSLGNGLEASDHVQEQITSLRGYEEFRVFVPVE